MKNIRHWLHGFIFVALGFFQELAVASDFADAFNEFILGSDANSTTIDNLLINSTQSQKCMQCHDGSSAKAIVLKNAEAPLQISGHRNVNHPVGLNYSLYANKSPASYVSRQNLDVRIQLENGNITCVSCHEIRAVEQQVNASADISIQVCGATGELTIGMERGGLCMSCHAM